MTHVATATPTGHVVEERDEPPALTVQGLTKSFRRANGSVVTPVDDISLTIREGEFVVLLGPSGCGKTTLLRCIAGLEIPDRGSIALGDTAVFDASAGVNRPPERRGIAMMFQSYALFPHMTVEDNVAYPLRAARVPKEERRRRVDDALRLVGVSEIATQLPGKLSGGQQQRVSLARALVAEPKIILFDEPLSNVDAKVREELRVQLLEMQKRVNFTAVYVTHDQVEALELADRIAVLRDGVVQQLDSPSEVYDRPVSRYVANFIGSVNEVPGTIMSVGERSVDVRFDGDTGAGDEVRLPLPTGQVPEPGSTVHLAWRPERTVLLAAPTDVSEDRSVSGPTFAGELLFKRFFGIYHDAIFRLPNGIEIRALSSREIPHQPGEVVHLGTEVDDVRLFGQGGD
ncbi:ABC transporter ATP-binding protein [Actinophytocola sp.]|uniref:ABC transporter ATP-binding protein n=1 Tax=Actinophytocola sp. TaxID=1872138 RepID=UPI003D6A7A25